MAFWLRIVLSVLIGYALGNVSVGILIARCFGVEDIRKKGSGNAGSTNVLRNLGWLPGVLTLAGDCLKAFAASKLGGLIGGDVCLLAGGLAAIVGHDYPVLFRFRGGKGIASTLGLILAIDARIGLILLALVVLLTALTRMVSVGSLSACLCYPVLTALMLKGRANYTLLVIFSIAASALAIFCHRANIGRLLKGKENKLDFGKISKLSGKKK